MTRIAAVLSAVAAVFLLAAASAAAGVVAQKQAGSQADVRAYWTAERMANAKPKEKAPNAKGKPGGGNAPFTSFEAPLPYPTTQGKVFFTDSGVNYVCSGTALASTNQSVVWTAGHCVNEGPGGFYTNFMFVPAYRDNVRPLGTFVAETLLTTSGWSGSGEFGVDLGAAVVGTNTSGQSLNAAAGGRSIVFNSPANQTYTVYGYPAAGRFNGQRLRVCQTQWARTDTSTNPDTMGVGCDMTGGSSGGGWITSSGAVASVVSYGYGNLKNVLFGPHQEGAAQSLFSDAERR